MLQRLTQLIKRIKSDDMARHGILMAAFGFAMGLFNYFYQLAMGRMLQPDEYSILMSLTSLFLIVSIFSLTIRTAMAKFISKYEAEGKWAEIGHLWRLYLKRMLILGAAAFLLAALLSPVISGFLKINNALYPLTMFSALILAFALPMNFGTLNGLHRFLPLGWTTTLVAFLKVVLAVVLIKIGFGIYGGLLPYLLSFIIVFAITVYLLKNLPKRDRTRLEVPGFHSYLGLSFIAILSYTMLTNIDIVLVKHFLTEYQAGNYSTVAVLGKVALFAPMGIALAMFPKTSGLHETGKGHRPILFTAMLLTIVIAGAFVVIYQIAPEFIVGFLGKWEDGGLKYSMAPPHLVRYSLAMLLFAISYILMNYFLSINQTRVAYPFMATAFIQVILIIYFHSDIGQVVNVILTSAALCLVSVMAFYLWGRRHPPPLPVQGEA
jgi:O-antigen/teichoic acid export membrane protein